MGKSRDSYADALGLREVETALADTFEAEFPIVTGRTVEISSAGESPDRIALVDGIETGVELTGIRAGSAGEIIGEIMRISDRKGESYSRRGIFTTRPIILLPFCDSQAVSGEGLKATLSGHSLQATGTRGNAPKRRLPRTGWSLRA